MLFYLYVEMKHRLCSQLTLRVNQVLIMTKISCSFCCISSSITRWRSRSLRSPRFFLMNNSPSSFYISYSSNHPADIKLYCNIKPRIFILPRLALLGTLKYVILLHFEVADGGHELMT